MIHKLTIECFTSTAAVEAACRQMADDRLLAKSRVTIQPGGMAGAAAHYADHPSPRVMIVEEAGALEWMTANLGALAEVVEPGCKVIVIGTLNDIGLYRTLMSQGVSEYLVAPVGGRDLVAVLDRIFADPSATPRGKVLAFFGARGGTGSSTVAHNLAWSMGKAVDDGVVVIDFDFGFGTAGLAFNLEAKQTLAEVLGQPDRIDMVLMERFAVAYDEHLQILPSSANAGDVPVITADGLDRVIDLARQMAPIVVLDLPHQWSPWVINLMIGADELIVTALPDLANLRDCKSLFEGVGRRRGEGAPTRVLLNRTDAYRKTQLSAKDFEDNLDSPPLASIPFDPVLFGAALNNGQMVGETATGHKIAETFLDLAVRLAGRQPAAAQRKGGSLLGWLKTAARPNLGKGVAGKGAAGKGTAIKAGQPAKGRAKAKGAA